MNNMSEQIIAFWNQAASIWVSGGWGMIALAVNALVMVTLGMHVLFRLRQRTYQTVPEKMLRNWMDNPSERKGPLGELMNYVMGVGSLKQANVFFEELRSNETTPFERDLKVMKICVTASPLLGLLGTVTGMLATFGALASGSGGEKTMGMIAEGISEALITTETGLVIALPGLFFQYLLSRKLEGYKVYLSHIETICTQKLYKDMRAKKANESLKDKPVMQRKIKLHRLINRAKQVQQKPVKQVEKVA